MTRSPESRGVAAWRLPDLRTVAAPGGADQGPSPEEAAYQRGWEEGRNALREDDQTSLTARLATLAAVERALAQAAELLQQRFTESVHALSIGVARHVLGAELERNPEHIRSLVARALSLAPLGGPLTVHLHPDDLESVRDLPVVRESTQSAVELRWLADPSLLRGGCVIEGPSSVVDGRIDRVLLDIYERLVSE